MDIIHIVIAGGVTERIRETTIMVMPIGDDQAAAGGINYISFGINERGVSSFGMDTVPLIGSFTGDQASFVRIEANQAS